MSQPFESARPTGRRLMWDIFSPLMGSNSPSYVQMDWRKVRTENFQQEGDGAVIFTDYVGDARAQFLPPRSWKKVGLAGIRTDELDALKTKFETDDIAYHEGVAFHGKYGSYLGLFPPDITFGTIEGQPDELFVASRIGFRTLRFSPVLFEPVEKKIYQPGPIRQGGTFAIDSMPTKFPEVPIT